MTTSTILDTLLISLGAWLIGCTLGGALGALVAVRIRDLFTAAPHLRRLSLLIPSRTVILNLLIATLTPAGIFIFGIGRVYGLVNTSLDIFLLAVVFTTSLFFEAGDFPPFPVQVIGGLRTLATTALVAAAFLSDPYGIGWYMLRSMTSGLMDDFFRDWLVLAVLILVVDIIFGVIQLGFADRISKRPRDHSLTRHR